ncbi:transcription factor GTE4 [Medicago truncatula]|uniref:Transcription factor GTE4-like protein n=1 Tax=Medicago truncatula TaxID=3880 RepID=A0A072VBT0_MEDTR|nr:transcription factor GTE4 [Medicago truncatula]KEH39252.1 transcription factor GTE4-like protein [Medicago truncatula]
MDSGTVVEDKVVREIQRYSEGKVYTRKNFKVSEDKVNSLEVVPHTHSGATTATVTVDGTKDNGNNVSVQLLDIVLVPEDGNSAPPVVNSGLDVVSEDSSSLCRRQDEHFSLDVVQLEDGNDLLEPALRRCDDKKRLENGVKNGLASRSKQEMRGIKRKLEGYLETVRSLVIRIEEKQRMAGRYGGGLNVSVDRYRVDNGSGAKRAHSEVASAGVPREANRFTRQLSVMVLENGHGISESVEKEKRTPKANQFYSNSEFLLAKDKFPPAESNKKSKSHGKKHGVGEMGHGFGIVSKYLKNCSSLLEKLMKHKHGWVFNTPVDVERLGLHDYFIIISQPMDLGTVKSRLSKNWYKSPKEFAEDVRLTFHNAMTYNPKGQDVHVMAEELSALFEERWAIIESNYNHEMRYGLDYGPAISAPSPLSRKTPALRPPPLDMRNLDRSESITNTRNPLSLTRSVRTPAPKKPKANDPDKRDMTYEEKQKLSIHLQNLPPEKLDAIVQIIKKRNSALSQHDDEIEVDIDSVDAETLWELDRYVTNYKKSLSKYKRKAELAIQARAEAERIAQQKSQEPPVIVDSPRERQADERNASPSLAVQGEIRVDNNGNKTSSSSSSSSDSGSSTSDSDSDSSSSSGSDSGSQ